ncbi:hypothetical protein GCM10022419_133070 [Nonomuraea rosea]|uniref:Uncharacterized protein n=2 Tax=Nonomuraea rosea TaxID=638574 RepID=A0ABP7A4Q9_9ACTN
MVHWSHRWLAAAAHLLQRWGPVDSETGLAAFRFAAISGTAATPEERPWMTTPELTEVARYGGFPQTFTGAGRAGLRHPVAVQPLNHALDRGWREGGWAAARPPEEVAHEAGLLLTSQLNAVPGKLGEPARELIAELVREMFVHSFMNDWVRVTVAARPDGPALSDEVHLLGRDLGGETFRLSVASAASLSPLHKAGRWPDPARLLTRTTDPRRALTEQQYRHADLGVRVACTAEVLGEYVWLTNNDRMKVTVKVGPHGLNLDCQSPDADATFRTWWCESAPCADLLREEWWEDEDITGPRRLDEETLARFLADFEEHNLGLARSGAWAMRQIGDYGPEDDPRPRFPGDRLVALLGRDLFDTVTRQVTSGFSNVRPLAYGIGVPFDIGPDDYGFYGCLLLVGPAFLGLITIEAMA